VKAKGNPKRVVFAEADNYKILKAAQIVKDEGIAFPILLGDIARIQELIKEHSLDLADVKMIDPHLEVGLQTDYAKRLFEKRKRRGITLYEAKKLMRDRNHFGAMMVEIGEADALISGLTKNYPGTIRPALQIIGMDEEVHRVAGMYLMLTKQGPIFLADTTVNIDPTVDELVEITNVVAKAVQKFNITPRIAMLSYSNFGSSETGNPVKVRQAVEKLHKIYPDMIVDGEMQANFALNEELLKDNYPFSTLVGGAANTLIFPNLDSGNAAYKILQEIGGAEAVGPILIGMKKPVHILQLGSSVREIVNMITIAVVDAQSKEEDIESAKSTPKVKRGIFRKN
jgi:malate dehydrogenase (oxaloacetate-decarboxylating)(NADP+)